jgi:neural Wiskott-Aldrich syndrome protein
MSSDPNKKSARTFQCRDVLWETFEQMARELECSVDYLINEAMKQYARQRSYGTRTPFPGDVRGGRDQGSMPPAREHNEARSQRGDPHGGYGGPPPPQQGLGARGGPLPPPTGNRPQMRQPGGLPVPPPRGGGGMHGLPPPPPRGMDPRGMDRDSGGRGGLAMPPVPPSRSVPPPAPRSVPPPLPRGPSNMPPMPGGMGSGNGGYQQQGHGGQLNVVYQGEKVAVTKDRFVIGRGKQSSDLTLKDPNVSRQHAMIEFQNGVYFMVDMGSTNGVEFNGQRIARKQIAEGDTFKICDHDLRFTYR